MLHPEGAALLGDIIVDFMREARLRCVGGLAMGAVPLVAAVAAASYGKEYPVDAFFVRKEVKSHGAKERIDGHLPEGAEVLVVDDVTTTGGSTLKAVEAMVEERRCTVRQALSIVDREEGACEELARHGIGLSSLFTRRDFLPD
jgi:orotate phosphoribosyltransferase